MEIFPKTYSDNILDSVILAPQNDDCTLINTDILNQIPGEQRTYHSYDKIICDNGNDINNPPVYRKALFFGLLMYSILDAELSQFLFRNLIP